MELEPMGGLADSKWTVA